MRISTDLLYRWVRALGSGDARPDALLVEIPPLLLPVVTLPGTQTRLAGGVVTDIRRESFVVSTGVTQTNGGGGTTELVTMGRGLWDLLIAIAFDSNYLDVPGTDSFSFQLRDPAVSILTLVKMRSHLDLVIPRVVYPVRLLFPDDGWDLVVTTAANGVGQTMRWVVSIVGNRLN